jgi:hypothetical protein
MAPMPQWELPHTKVEQAQRTVGLLHKDFHYSVKNREQFSAQYNLFVLIYLCLQIHKN